MNLYAYVGEDPVNNTDPTGKRIKFIGSPVQKALLISELIKVASSSPELTKRFETLVNSKNLHTLEFAKERERSVNAIKRADKPDAVNGTGVGTRTIINIRQIKLKDGTVNTLGTLIAHEFFSHAYDADQGRLDESAHPDHEIPNNELIASQLENEYRSSIDMDLRTQYGDKKLPCLRATDKCF